jgi:inorganic pyrophosphatase
MKIKDIPSTKDHLILVVLETPRGTVYKYDYDFDLGMFRMNKILPLGMVFPFDFGFIPSTKAEDGDPLDVLLLLDEPGMQGTLVPCRPIAVLEASQKEKGEEFRNDRIVAVAEFSHQFKGIDDINQLNPDLPGQIEIFFKQYNLLAGKEFIPLGWQKGRKAFALIKKYD